MIKKVYIIGGGAYNENIDSSFKKIESDFLSGKTKNQSYELMITKGFIDKYGKDNVINCRVRGLGEYKNIIRYRGYSYKYIELFKELRKNRKDSLFMFHGVYPWVLMYSLIPARYKCWWRHAIIGPYNKCESKLKRITLWFIQKIFGFFIDTIFYVNDYEKKELFNYHYRGNIYFLPIPINTDFWKANEKNINNGKIIHVTSTGIVCKRKNQKIIIDAINLIKKKHPNLKFEINLIGQILDTKYKTSLQDNPNNIKLIFHGRKTANQLKEIYKNTDIYIQASFSEGLCQTYIEACLSGCSLVLSNIPTFTETARDCALFFDPFDATDLSKKLLDMIGNMEKYGEKSKELAKEFEKFGYKSFYKQLFSFLSTKIKKV